ncbi:protein-L-isoaspartate(D-aspartate) O-methyltransferase [Roseateles sp. DAIF2]|uniref:protein-L-isoaspartate(D-aspartate) O-methyltransferase n=1 Tax=Roseateles sp. DAIF2 TaxID=2714952 RepID=UPI0018A2CC08|nr:protein-L-isoaspartate(D-aspartate) O-methyltransferase [Roseateles sp. DAIF2]QPF73034.1 protein-L-isoaspartate(D-aspartate) O-methyltransferase [Roseateles sp. DAIF2]
MPTLDFAVERQRMLAHIVTQAVCLTLRLGKAALDGRVLRALERVPRHEFLPPELRALAYADTALPADCGKTVSQPLIVALMSDLLGLQPGDRVLEIGTGMGYQTAVLAELGCEVCSVERIPALSRGAAERLEALGYEDRVELRIGDGRLGWPEQAPFDAIIATAAAEQVPPALVGQLRPGGRLVMPLGPPDAQQLVLGIKGIGRDAQGVVGALSWRVVLPVRFSLLEGE